MSELNKEMTLLPPPELVQYVGGDFKKVGKEFLKHFIQIGALKSNEKVRDYVINHKYNNSTILMESTESIPYSVICLLTSIRG